MQAMMMMMMPQQVPQQFPLASPCGTTKSRLHFGRSNSDSDASTGIPTTPATPATPASLPMPASPVCKAGQRNSKGPIAQLQEFVQSSKSQPLPGSCAVLQWKHDNRMAGSKLQFSATAAFLLDGVAHHIQGGWWPSKKQAQRDTADRALCFFVGMCGQQVINNAADAHAGFVDGEMDVSAASAAASDLEKAAEEGEHVLVLELFCDSALNWRCCWEAPQAGCGQELLGGVCRATVEISCLGVPHTFAGRQCSSKAAAMQDTAKRVLWYMSCPGYESAFEVVPEQVKTLAQTIPPPVPGCWSPKQEDAFCCASPSAKSACSDIDSNPDGISCASPSQQHTGPAELDRKMTVMNLQNRLQKLFAKQLTSGQSVWHWHYERSNVDSTFQASVEIPVLGQTFTGGWVVTHQAAQMEACHELGAFLDKAART